MPYKPNYKFSEFIDTLYEFALPEFDPESYQRAAGRIAEKARDKFVDQAGLRDERASRLPAWLSQVSDFRGEFTEEDFEKARRKFNQSKIDTLKYNKANAMNSALLFHYRLHMYHAASDLELAHELDREVFGGKRTFLTVVGKPVFAYVPDEYHFPPPMQAPMSHPPYIGRSEVERLISNDRNHGVWLNPHNHFSIPLEGRDEEQSHLTRFMEHESSFRVLPVIAPSGAGKTRLISEWMKEYSPVANQSTEWEAGFLVSKGDGRARDPEPWRAWIIQQNTLIVIDYTYAFDDVVKAIAERVLQSGERIAYKIRLLVVDHEMPRILNDDFFWRNLLGVRPSETDILEARYLAKPIRIRPQAHDSPHLRKIISACASVGGKKVQEDDARVSQALDHLREISSNSGGKDNASHPLFAALLGREIRDAHGTPDFSTWSRRDLVDRYFSHDDRLPWGNSTVALSSINKGAERGLLAGAIVAATTLRRGMKRIDVQRLVENSKAPIQVAQRVTSTADDTSIDPYLPDILGETFLLKFLQAAWHLESFKDRFLKLLLDPKADQLEVARNFRETMSRLARNLAADNQEHPEVQSSWRLVSELLTPALYVLNPRLRTYISYSISDTLEALNQAIDNEFKADRNTRDTLTEVKSGIEEKFDLRRVCSISWVHDYIPWIREILKYYEASSRKHDASTRARVISAVEKFWTISQDTTASMYAALDGRGSVLQLISEELRSDLVRRSKQGWTPAMLASQAGHIEALRFLLKYDKSATNAKTANGTTLAMAACANGQVEVLAFLREKGFLELEQVGHNGNTLETLACKIGHLEVVKFLHQECKCSFLSTTYDGGSCLLLASQEGHFAIVRYLCEVVKCDPHVQVGRGRTAAMSACKNGHLEIVQYLFHFCSVDFHLEDNFGWTAFMYAIQSDSLPMLRFLRTVVGANLVATTADGSNCAHLAANQGRLIALNFIANECAEVFKLERTNGSTPFMLAASSGHLSSVKFIHRENLCDVNATMHSGGTSLMLASQGGHLDVVKYLHEQCGAEIDKVASDGQTALLLATYQGKYATVAYLLGKVLDLPKPQLADEVWIAAMVAVEQGYDEIFSLIVTKTPIDFDRPGRDHHSIKEKACYLGRLEAVELIIQSGSIDFDAVNQQGWSPALAAAQHGHLPVLRVLLERAQCTLDVPGKGGATPLIFAAQSNRMDIVKFLCEEAGVEPDVPSGELGATPFIIACQNGHLEIVKFLAALEAVNVNLQMKNGHTAFIQAASQGQLEVVRYLYENEYASSFFGTIHVLAALQVADTQRPGGVAELLRGRIIFPNIVIGVWKVFVFLVARLITLFKR